ncbi:protein transporter Sec31 [Streptomyces sp. DH12]|uniref:protein transporter Sec31 n=1 Tax=Streptomyces sp. DH12 TaxID=2857010 RepID=UPI001E60CD2E|nr:protein transporter Sec31 [Streptomyces sp. DH12]
MRFRTERRDRWVPHTIDGRTTLVNDPVDITIPAPPHDWDTTIRRGVDILLVLMLTAAIVWSTASIGSLLDRRVDELPAYAAAACFDAAWIACMALEWLARYDPKRAAPPRRAGHVALLLAMAAIAAEHVIDDQWAVGLVGAAVSLIAKALWTLRLQHTALPLGTRDQQWVDQQRAELQARRALGLVRRELAGMEETAALTTGHRTSASPDADAEAPHDAPADTPDTPQVSAVWAPPAGTSKSELILAAASSLPPGAAPRDIADHLARHGHAVDVGYVRTVMSRAKKPKRTPPRQPTLPETGPDTVGRGGGGYN